MDQFSILGFVQDGAKFAFLKELLQEGTRDVKSLVYQRDNIEWSRPDNQQSLRGLVLVVHGLNLKASRMQALVRVLVDQGYMVGNLTLAGHRGDKSQVGRDAWLQDYEGATLALRELSNEHGGLPIYAVCMSLGALTLVDFMTEHPQHQPFEKILMLAPALSLRWYSHIFRFFARWLPGFPIPSFSRAKDRVYRSLPLQFYGELYKAQDMIGKKLKARPLKLPVSIMMDPRDELVSYAGVENLLRRGCMPMAQLQGRRLPAEAAGTYHLFICPESMGQTVWEEVTGELKEFFTQPGDVR
jgi:alpha-beta hydrolase superfamily lysophospholipase